MNVIPGIIYYFRFYQRFADRMLYPSLLRSIQGISVQGNIRLTGWPLLDIRNGASIELGENVTLNSRNLGYHGNLNSPVKLYAEERARIRIGANTRIHGTCIHAIEKISIGRNCLIGGNTQIFDSSGHTLSFSDVQVRLNTRGKTKPIDIEDNVWIGMNVIILPGVRIGAGSVIAAGSVVTESVDSFTLAGGNPIRVIRTFKPDGTIEPAKAAGQQDYN